MSQVFSAFSIWVHALATAIFVGYYLLLVLVFIPALAPGGNGSALADISKRSRPWLYTSLIVFAVTGIWLMAVDTAYAGFLRFGNVWSVMMLVKHVLILAIVVLGFWFNAMQRVGPAMRANSGVDLAIARFRTHALWMAVAGALVLLLTAIAQVG